MSSRETFLKLAPHWLVALIKTRPLYHLSRFDSSGEPGQHVHEDEAVRTLDLANVMSSESSAGWHRIMLDIDKEAALIPSTNKGHWHLYVNVNVPWENLEKLLDAMVECGIVERGYAETSKMRGATFLRMPWVRKGREQRLDDTVPALDAWVLESDPHYVPIPEFPPF